MATMEQMIAPRTVEDRYKHMNAFLHIAGRRMQEAFARNFDLRVEIKPDGSKVTNVDYAINDLFIDHIMREFPSDAVFGEEGAFKTPDYDPNQNWHWVIDPVDGTGGFVRNAEARTEENCTSAVMIAAFAPGDSLPCMAAVYKPFGDPELYTMHDWMTFMNDRGPSFDGTRPTYQPLETLTLDKVRDYDIDPWTGAEPDIRQIIDFLPERARKVKVSSIGVSAGRVATGSLDLSVFPGPVSNRHDYVPAIYIMRHAKTGWATNLEGTEYSHIDMRQTTNGLILAGSSKLGESVLEIVTKLQLNA